MVLLRPANCRTTDAPDSTEPVTDTPASFSARVTVSFPAIVERETVGGVVSICHVFAVDDADEFPAASVATAEMRWLPSERVDASNDHVPPDAITVASTVDGVVELSLITTVAPDSAVPDNVGVASLVITGDVPLTTGTDGADVS